MEVGTTANRVSRRLSMVITANNMSTLEFGVRNLPPKTHLTYVRFVLEMRHNHIYIHFAHCAASPKTKLS